jgi:hypothetical protein
MRPTRIELATFGLKGRWLPDDGLAYRDRSFRGAFGM